MDNQTMPMGGMMGDDSQFEPLSEEELNTPEMQAKRAKILPLLPDSDLIAQSPYTVEQWEKIIGVLPGSFLDELFGYLTLEQHQSGE